MINKKMILLTIAALSLTLLFGCIPLFSNRSGSDSQGSDLSTIPSVTSVSSVLTSSSISAVSDSSSSSPASSAEELSDDTPSISGSGADDDTFRNIDDLMDELEDLLHSLDSYSEGDVAIPTP